MRVILLFIVSALALTTAFYVDSTTKQEFKDFIHQFGRNYSMVEHAKRELIFAKNKMKRAAHNLKHKMSKIGWEDGINQFADMTPEEFIHSLGYDEDAQNDYNNGTEAISAATYFKDVESKRFLTEIDWRTKGKDGAVKNQGKCGSCWAFATTASTESCVAISQNVQPPNLSEQHLQDCMFSKLCSPGGGGGASAIDYVKTNGVAYGQDYPYTQTNGQCHKPTKVAKAGGRVHGRTEDELANMLAKGPVLIGINASPLQGYRKGIVDDASASKGRNHAVTVVGVTSKCDNKATECWIVKNSWGTGWGEKGYFRVAKGQNIIGLGDDSDMPIQCTGSGDKPSPNPEPTNSPKPTNGPKPTNSPKPTSGGNCQNSFGNSLVSNGMNKDEAGGKEMYSQNCQYKLSVQADGNLVIYDTNNRARWNTRTQSQGTNTLMLHEQGNVVLYNAQNHAMWSSNTWVGQNKGPFKLTMENTGKLVLTDGSGKELWDNEKKN